MKVHYWELSNYNNGKLIGRWFDLDGTDEETHKEEIQTWLNELTTKTGELCEEWILGDVEDIPDHYVEEYGIHEDFWEYLELIENSHLDAEQIEAGVACNIQLSDIEEAYSGNYSNDEEFAQEMTEELGYMDEEAHWPYTCIDWEWAARELMYDYVSSDGFYFRRF